MSNLVVQDNDDYTIVRCPRGRIIAVVGNFELVPTVDFPSGTQMWDPSTGKFYILSGGSWSVAGVNQAQTQATTLTVSGASTQTGLITATAGVDGPLAAGNTLAAATFGASLVPFVNEEEIDMGGADELAAVQSTGDLIPINSIIWGVGKYVTESFTGDAANYDIGDESTATRFVTNSTDLTLADTDIHNEDLVSTVPETAASKIEILLNDAATAGKLRISVFGIQLVASTS